MLYVIKCSSCGEEYIGQTGDYLWKRVKVHSQPIRDPKTRMLYVSGHIDTCANQSIPTYTIFPFYKIYCGNMSSRCAKVKYFIKLAKPKLKTVKKGPCHQNMLFYALSANLKEMHYIHVNKITQCAHFCQMFLLNMAFISSNEVENIHIF